MVTHAGAGLAPGGVITPAMDRHNGRIVILSAFLHYLAAPVIYVGIVQTALCDRLGASFTFGLAAAIGVLILVLGLSSRPIKEETK